MNSINNFIYKNIKTIELFGVILRIWSFSIVSWLWWDSPFLLVWAVNTFDAILLSWCSLLKKDLAYTILNIFWVLIWILWILRAASLV